MSRFNPIRLGAVPAKAGDVAIAGVASTPKPKLEPLMVGTRVHCILYGGMDGIIYHIRGQQTPETIGSMSGVISYGGSAYFDIVFLGQSAHLSNVPESIVRGVQWEILPGLATKEEIDAAMVHAEEVRVAKEKEAERKAEERRQKAEAFRREYSWLQTAGNGESGAKLAAINIRTQLKRAFPGIKFSVRSDHNSVDVRWEMGPTATQVCAITDRYQQGHFDGMADIYENNEDDSWTRVFGGAKYVNESRRFPENFMEQLGRDLCALQHVAYGGTYTMHLMGESDTQDLDRHLRELLNKTDFPDGALYKGVEAAEWNDPARKHWCRIVFETPSEATTEPVSGGGIQLKPNKAKSGLELHFDSVPPEAWRTELKAAGWRWSRFGGCWYHKDNPENQAFAEQFLAKHSVAASRESAANPPPPIATAKPEIERCSICGDGPPKEGWFGVGGKTFCVKPECFKQGLGDTQKIFTPAAPVEEPKVLHVEFCPENNFVPPVQPAPTPSWRRRSTR